MWLALIKRSFWGLFVAIETVGVIEELMEIWPNEVCDIFLLMKHADSFFGYTFCGATTHTTLSLSSFLLFWHSFHQCSSSLHLKYHITSSSFLFFFCLLISTPYLITLLNNTLNLFWETNVLFSFSFLFLQLQARYPNFLYL